jgi:hypothetical protein
MSKSFSLSVGLKVGDQIYLGFVNLNTFVGNNMPQNNPLFYHEVAFFPIQNQVLLLTSYQHQGKMVQAILK